ncbi:peptidoglycan binding domain-containing protein, partial [Patescibacteria group bacterium]|nr:peptidoglycan binding domain-containing protein [Patescibacteria group bacterium]MBU4511755.1 peptidoglycan binding domain-containing protein [Patescibacteria group bacterium]
MPSSPLEKIQNIAKDVSQDVKKNKNVWKRWFFVIAGVFSTLIILLIGAIFIYNQVHAQKIYPGVYIGKMNLGGYAPEEAREALHRLTNKINREGILFVADTGDNYKETRITPILIAPEDPDIAREILRFDLEQTLNQAWQLGRQGNFLNKVKYQLLLLIQPQEVALDYSLDNEEFKKILSQNFFELENPGQDARLEIKNHQVSVIPEKYGNSFDYDGALRELERRAAILGFDKPIELKLKIDYPKIKAGDTLLLAAKAEQILEKFKGSSLILKYEDATWEIKQKEIEAWLKFDLKNENDLIININQSSTTAFLENIAKEIDIEVKEPLFTLSTSTDDELKAVEFQAGAGGLKLDMENSCEKIMQEIIKSGELNEVRLVSRVIKPRQTIGDVNDLGIKDLLGVGESNFSGSPTNRRHNIGVGANKLNGLLIAPDEEFSLVQTLGEVNAATGYLPE